MDARVAKTMPLTLEYTLIALHVSSLIAEEFYPDIAENPSSVDSLYKALRKFDRNCSDSSSTDFHNLSSQETGQLLISFSRVKEEVVPGISIIIAHIASTDPGNIDPDWSDWSYKWRASLRLIFFFDSDSDLIAVYSQHLEA